MERPQEHGSRSATNALVDVVGGLEVDSVGQVADLRPIGGSFMYRQATASQVALARVVAAISSSAQPQFVAVRSRQAREKNQNQSQLRRPQTRDLTKVAT